MIRKLLHALLVGLGAGLFALALWALGALNRFEEATWSYRVNWLARPSPATARIKLIAIDRSSLDWVQEATGETWIWPRQVYAPILKFCRRAGAKVVLVGDVRQLQAIEAGAPMRAYTRISDKDINIHSSVTNPDAAVVIDPTLLTPEILEGLPKDGVLVVNSTESVADIRKKLGYNGGKVAVGTVVAHYPHAFYISEDGKALPELPV